MKTYRNFFVYFEGLLYSKILHPSKGVHYVFWEGIMIFKIFLAKDILISSQRYNDFSDNSVLYYPLHFLTSPSTIRLEVKDNSLHSVKPLFWGICGKWASPWLPPQGALISVITLSWGFILLIMLFSKA